MRRKERPGEYNLTKKKKKPIQCKAGMEEDKATEQTVTEKPMRLDSLRFYFV